MSPVPLGKKIVVIASRDKIVAVSNAVKVDAANPTGAVKLVMPKGQMITGKVLDENGNPKPGVPVTFHLDYHGCRGGHSWSPGVRTDSSGSFREGPFNPAAGVYRVSASQRDYVPVTRKLKNLDSPLTIRLQRGKVQTGKVLDKEAGWPIEGVQVYARPENLRSWDGPYRFEAEQMTDAKGHFRFSNLPNTRMTYSIGGEIRSQNVVVSSPNAKRPVTLYGTLYEWSKVARVVKPKDAESATRD